MASNREERMAARLRLAFDLYEAGEDLMRQNLRRQDPQADDAEIERRLVAWLRHRPGAEQGDAVGIPGTWPRRQP
jgi:Rv0078B-related antitoxin